MELEMSQIYDVAVVGGGIVGMATAMALSKHADLSLVVLETEDHLGCSPDGT